MSCPAAKGSSLARVLRLARGSTAPKAWMGCHGRQQGSRTGQVLEGGRDPGQPNDLQLLAFLELCSTPLRDRVICIIPQPSKAPHLFPAETVGLATIRQEFYRWTGCLVTSRADLWKAINPASGCTGRSPKGVVLSADHPTGVQDGHRSLMLALYLFLFKSRVLTITNSLSGLSLTPVAMMPNALFVDGMANPGSLARPSMRIKGTLGQKSALNSRRPGRTGKSLVEATGKSRENGGPSQMDRGLSAEHRIRGHMPPSPQSKGLFL
ncbi:hypothetical protein BDZ85DRAFT_256787 [Elsinoe ampelina]|uniref:Uncharacterized protein n=1 Tax=Elsinoe ampelina TaxID=302913 RepID=A0A6A6GM45_9PEZI|nr:hypothetical protein BDZ85DRAFT_256787 [Elsinoe ampelina]